MKRPVDPVAAPVEGAAGKGSGGEGTGGGAAAQPSEDELALIKSKLETIHAELERSDEADEDVRAAMANVLGDRVNGAGINKHGGEKSANDRKSSMSPHSPAMGPRSPESPRSNPSPSGSSHGSPAPGRQPRKSSVFETMVGAMCSNYVRLRYLIST